MWYLIASDNPDQKHVILGGKVYLVGRKDCDILISNDATVSRKHAELSVSHSEVNLNDVNRLPILLLKDLSKFGTWVNNMRLQGERMLKDGDTVYFGSPKTTFMIVYEPLVITSSCLDTASKKSVRKQLSILGGHMVNEWRADCHLLVMNRISVTIKVVCALISQTPVVTPAYLETYVKHLQGQAETPDPNRFTPELAETQLDPSEVSFKPDERRKTLFQGMTFVFLSEKQLKKLGTAVELAGGTPLLMAEEGEDNILLDRKTVVMGMAQGEMSQADEASKWACHVQQLLDRNGKHMAQDAEVGYAVLYCSTEKHCNPDYTPDKDFSKLPSQSLSQMDVFVPNTETQTGSQQKPSQGRKAASSQLVVNETVVTKAGAKKSTASAMPQSETQRASPEKTQKVKQEPVAQSTPQSMRKKRARAEEEEEKTVTIETTSKRVKTEPVTPITKGKNTQKVNTIDDWDSDDEIDYSSIEIDTGKGSSAKGSSESSKKTRSRSRSPLEVVSSGKKKQTRSSSRSPHKDKLEEECVEKNQRQTRSRSRSPYKGHRIVESDNDSRSRSPIGRKRKTGVKTETEDQMPMSVPSDSNSRSQNSSSTKDTRQPVTSVKQEDTVVPKQEFTSLPGYLTAQNNVKGQVSRNQDNAPDDDLPSNCVKVEVVSLIARLPRQQKTIAKNDCPDGFTCWKGKVVKNFKKFKKTSHAGSQGLPTIIGGSDLEVHQSERSKEMDGWFREAMQAESQQANEDKRASELFDFNPGAKRRGR